MSHKWSPAARRLLVEKLPRAEVRELRTKLGGIQPFASGFVGIRLRPYQVEAANAILKSALARDGNSFVLLFARQSGKDELIANLILYLLARLAETGLSIVCAQPTFRPQTINAMDRLQARASQRPFFKLGGFHRTHGYIYEFLSARVTYLSAEPSASVVGATSDRLLIINEAQDVQPGVYDKRFAPMAASGNATRLFSGTAWTGDTLLDREKRAALHLEQQDGVRRVFVVDGESVSRSNRLYAKFLDQEIARLGRGHPLIRTQYFCENIDARSRMFTPAHRALMASGSPPHFRSTENGEGLGGGALMRADAAVPSPNALLPAASREGGRRPGGVPLQPGVMSRLADASSDSHLHHDPKTFTASGQDGEGSGGGAFVLGDPRLPPPAGQAQGERPIVNRDLLSKSSEIVNFTAFLLDIAGQEESNTSYGSDSSSTLFEPPLNPARDAVTLRIVEIDLSTLETLHAPTYRAVHLQQWTGQNHLTIFGQLKALAESWQPQHIVIDATGVGEGLWAMLDKAFPTRVIPVKFTQGVKSELGYGFLAIINTGRFRDYCGSLPSPSGEGPGMREYGPVMSAAGAGGGAAGLIPSSAQIDREYASCEAEILIGPQKTMRWGVPDGRRDEDGHPIHDDIPVTDSLTAILDRLEWSIHFEPFIIHARDPLDEMSRFHK